MKALLFLALTVSVWLLLRQSLCGTGRAPRCLRPRLGDWIQASLLFIYVTCHILWILPFSRAFCCSRLRFTVVLVLLFVVFHIFILFTVVWDLLASLFGTYVFSLGLVCAWARHMTDHGLGPFPSLTVHCQAWTSCGQLGDFGLLWHT